jgi:hypothetical protein
MTEAMQASQNPPHQSTARDNLDRKGLWHQNVEFVTWESGGTSALRDIFNDQLT